MSAGGPHRRLLVLLVLPALLAGGLAPPVAFAGAAEDPRARLERIDAELERVSDWLASRRADRDELARRLRGADLAVADLAGDVRAAETALAEQRARIRDLEDEIAGLVERETRQRDALRTQLRSAWLLARRDPLQLVMEAEAPDRMGRLLEYHRVLTAARLGAIEAWQSARAELADRRTTLAREELRLAEERDRLAARAEALASARDDRATVLATLEASIEGRQGAQAELERTRAELVALLERLSREAARPSGAAFEAARGALPWPVTPRILQAFGATPSGGLLSRDGVLIGADAGTAVRAVAPGVVAFADWLRGYGLVVIVDHGGGYLTLYAQAEALLRRVGDAVEAGEPVATAGQSGGSARSGIWFEIRRAGRPVDPVAWCGARTDAA